LRESAYLRTYTSSRKSRTSWISFAGMNVGATRRNLSHVDVVRTAISAPVRRKRVDCAPRTSSVRAVPSPRPVAASPAAAASRRLEQQGDRGRNRGHTLSVLAQRRGNEFPPLILGLERTARRRPVVAASSRLANETRLADANRRSALWPQDEAVKSLVSWRIGDCAAAGGAMPIRPPISADPIDAADIGARDPNIAISDCCGAVPDRIVQRSLSRGDNVGRITDSDRPWRARRSGATTRSAHVRTAASGLSCSPTHMTKPR
jgi:hypothetical protein